MTYVGPVFAEEELEHQLCPWCIADGNAADTYDAQFTDLTWRVPDDVSAEVTEVVLRRTPGFNGWQQERWLHHCGDGAEFNGRVGAKELRTLPDARAVLLADMAGYGWSADQLERFLESLDAGGSATAYLFRCPTAVHTWPTPTSHEPQGAAGRICRAECGGLRARL